MGWVFSGVCLALPLMGHIWDKINRVWASLGLELVNESAQPILNQAIRAASQNELG